MTTIEDNYVPFKQQILEFTINSVDKFLLEHSNTTFYGLAFDCDLDNGYVGLSFGSEQGFCKTVNKCKKSPCAEHSKTDESTEMLKKNSANWDFSCYVDIYTEDFDSYIMHPQELKNFDEEFICKYRTSILYSITEVLIEFIATTTYNNIPKSSDFYSICLDRNETISSALTRLCDLKAMQVATRNRFSSEKIN